MYFHIFSNIIYQAVCVRTDAWICVLTACNFRNLWANGISLISIVAIANEIESGEIKVSISLASNRAGVRESLEFRVYIYNSTNCSAGTETTMSIRGRHQYACMPHDYDYSTTTG